MRATSSWSGHRRRHPHASAGAQAARRAHEPVAAGGRGRRGAARHQPRPPALAMQVLEAASIIGLIRRTQSLDRTGRRRRRRPRPVPPRPRARRRRLRPADGDRGHRPDLEAAARRLADGVRAARARRHAGSGDAAARCGCSASAGPAARARCCTSTSRGEPLAQPAHVAARVRGGRVAGLGGRPRRVARDRRARRLLGRREPVRVRVRMGGRDRPGRDRPDDRRAHARARLRPQHLPGTPRRRALPDRVLDDLRHGGAPLARSSRSCAGPATARRLEHPARTASTPRLRRRTTRLPQSLDG